MAIASRGQDVVTFELFDRPPTAETTGGDSAKWTATLGVNTFVLSRHKNFNNTAAQIVTQYKTDVAAADVRSMHLQNIGRLTIPAWSIMDDPTGFAFCRDTLTSISGEFTTQSATLPSYISFDDLLDRPVRDETARRLWRVAERSTIVDDCTGIGAYGHKNFGTMLNVVVWQYGSSGARDAEATLSVLDSSKWIIAPWVKAPGLTNPDGTTWTAANFEARVNLCIEYNARVIYVFTGGPNAASDVDWSGMVTTLDKLLEEDEYVGVGVVD